MRRFLSIGRTGRRSGVPSGVPFRSFVVVVALSGVLASGVGFAAALALTPERLTIYTSASTVPITTCTLSAPAADTYVYEAALSAGSNFGTATTLHVRSEALGNKRSFVRFDLSSCSIPTSARVKTARMKLFLSSAPSSSRTYDVHRVTQSWGETTLTWNNLQDGGPTVASTATASVATGTTSNVTLESDVLADVQEFVAGSATNDGWRIKDSAEGALLAIEGRFSSREHSTASQRPSLTISFYL